MTDITATLETLLEADATLMALLTGGIYTKRAIGTKGIDPDNTPDAYTVTNGFPILQPCLVIKQRGAIPVNERSDVEEKDVSVQQVVELWFYDDNSYTAIESARARCYALLQYETLSGVGFMRLVNQTDDMRDQALNDAAMLRADYQTKRIQS